MKHVKTVAYYGAPASFSHQVARQHFPQAHHESFLKFDDCLVAVKNESMSVAVLPIENSNAKSIIEAQRQLLRHAGGVVVTDLIPHKIVHHLFSFGDLASIKTIRSKDVVFAQTSAWLAKNLPEAILDGNYSTSEAVKSLALEKDPALAAIGSEDAEIYLVPRLCSAIQTDPNITLFAVLKRGGADCPNFRNISRCLIVLEACQDSRISEMEGIVQEHGCFITYNWMLPGIDGLQPSGIFEIGNLGQPAPGALQTIAGKVIGSVQGAKFLGGFHGKTVESLLTGKFIATTTER